MLAASWLDIARKNSKKDIHSRREAHFPNRSRLPFNKREKQMGSGKGKEMRACLQGVVVKVEVTLVG